MASESPFEYRFLTDAHRQHRFVPAPATSASGYVATYCDFLCKCGLKVHQTPGIRADRWRWKYLTREGLRREWKRS